MTAISLLATAACGGSNASSSPELPEGPESNGELPAADAPQEETETEEAESEEDERAEQVAKAREELANKAEEESARWTDELRAQASELAAKEFDSFGDAVRATLASDHRLPGNADRDPYRHAVETLEYFGLEADMTVLEYGPGAGWYTEVLAPALSPNGTLIVTSPDVSGELADSFYAVYAERLQFLLDRSPALFGDVQKASYDPDAESPELGLSGEVDAALMIRGMHNRVRSDDLDPWLASLYDALRPGGVFGVVQHRAAPDADAEETAENGYLPQPWVIEQVEAAGFVHEESSEINANPDDTKDYERGVWTLPPTLALGDEDREKYEAIGESDRMTLRFVKPAE